MSTNTSFSHTLEIAREFFGGNTSIERAEQILSELKKSQSLCCGVIRNYLTTANYLHLEWQKMLIDLLNSLVADPQQIIPLLPSILPLISASSDYLRDEIVEIVKKLGEESLICEHFSYGFLRNNKPEVKIAGAKILLHLCQFKKSTFCQNLIALQEQNSGYPEVHELLQQAGEVCLKNHASCNMATNTVTQNQSPKTDLKDKKIMIVDDDPQIRALLSNILKRCNADITEAQNGREAADILDAVYGSNGYYDLVITDLRMPVLNGMHLIEHFRGKFPEVSTPIIILTAVKDKDIALTALNKYQIKSYLIKPVPISKFYSSINSVFPQNTA